MSSFLSWLSFAFSARFTVVIVTLVCVVIFVWNLFDSGALQIFKAWGGRRRLIHNLVAKKVVGALLATAFLFVPITFLAWVAVSIISVPMKFNHSRWETRTDMVMLQDGITSTGHFETFLGSGGGEIDGSMTYFYAIPAEGGIKVVPLTSPNVIVKEVPGLRSAYLVSSGEVFNHVAEKRVWRYSVLEDGNPLRGSADKYVFYVPPGTIDYKFQVDLE